MTLHEKGEFEIEIRKNGEVSVRTVGIKGAACVDAAKQFTSILGGREIESQRTHEYYEAQSTSVEDTVQTYTQW